ncbi:MAG: hypothetical protein WCP12_17675 [bacterium]
MRCLLMAEARHWYDCREQLVVAEFYWRLFQDTQSVKRCLLKATAAAKTEDHKERISEFLKKLGLQQATIALKGIICHVLKITAMNRFCYSELLSRNFTAGWMSLQALRNTV